MIFYRPQRSNGLCIVIPISLQIPAIRWMHSLLIHPVVERLHATLAAHFWFPRMKVAIIQFTNSCEICQRHKPSNRPTGFLAPKELQDINPLGQVEDDLIGPWKVDIQGLELSFRALTCIDPIISISEIIPIENATSLVTAVAFEDEWLSRYPRPLRCVHDNGNEFLGQEFQLILK